MGIYGERFEPLPQPGTSPAVRTNESATMSTFCETPNSRSAQSFSVMENGQHFYTRQIDALIVCRG